MVTTYCATTTSNEPSGKFEALGVHHLERLDVVEPELGRRARAPCAASRSEMSTPTMRLSPRVVGQRDAGADADLEDTAADPLGRLDRGAPAALEHRAEHQVVDRRPAVIGLSTAFRLDVDGYRPLVRLLMRLAD